MYFNFLNCQDPETDSIEEETEPKLKYSRLSEGIQTILSQDAVSCIAVHSRVRFALLIDHIVRL